MKRRLGLKIIAAVILAFNALLAGLGILIAMQGPSPALGEAGFMWTMGLMGVFIGIGLLFLQPWAYWLTVLGGGTMAILGVLRLMVCSGGADCNTTDRVLASLLLGLGGPVAGYLARPSVKADFVSH